MKLYRAFLTLSRVKQISLAVCFIHFLTVFVLICHHFVSTLFKPAKPMVVKTIQLSEPSQPKTLPIVAKPKQGTSKTKEKPKEVAKVGAVEKPKPTPLATKPVTKPKEKEERLLKEIASSLAALSIESRPRPPLSLPSPIQQKKEVQPSKDLSYGEFLIGYLQSSLDLPEYGEVRAKIEIDRFGNLIDVEILDTKSRKNGEFLKNQLPNLTFPCLNDFGIVDATHTFTITFRNVETR